MWCSVLSCNSSGISGYPPFSDERKDMELLSRYSQVITAFHSSTREDFLVSCHQTHWGWDLSRFVELVWSQDQTTSVNLSSVFFHSNHLPTTGLPKAVVFYYALYGIVHIKDPLLWIEKSNPCSGRSGFPISLSLFSFTITTLCWVPC